MSAEAVGTINETATKIVKITEADLAWWIGKISTLDWVFAVTYAEGAPHEYICDRTEGLTEADFERASRVIYTFGEPQKFYKQTRLYFVHDGWKYWTMDPDHTRVNLVNRGRAEHIYGVQNAPRTHSGHESAYDAVATCWDASLSVSEAEREGFTSLIEEVTGGYRKCRTLDLGAGTGLALDLGITDSFRLTAVDPSQAMLNCLVDKHPLVARIEPMSFTEARARRVLGGTRFDLVLALGGSGSYLNLEDWTALLAHSKGRLVVSVFAEGYAPVTEDLSLIDLAAAREHACAIADANGGRIDRVGRFDVLLLRA